jgi:hypothetical protein
MAMRCMCYMRCTGRAFVSGGVGGKPCNPFSPARPRAKVADIPPE